MLYGSHVIVAFRNLHLPKEVIHIFVEVAYDSPAGTAPPISGEIGGRHRGDSAFRTPHSRGAGVGDFNIDDFVSALGRGVDAAGVLVIVVGLIVATALFLIRWPPARVPDAYVVYRRRIGRVILLGLEVLVAGDIIRSVGSSPTFRSVGVLAVIVVIRTFLSL